MTTAGALVPRLQQTNSESPRIRSTQDGLWLGSLDVVQVWQSRYVRFGS